MLAFDAYAINWQYADLDGNGVPDYPPAVDPSTTGFSYVYGFPEVQTRGVVNVPMINRADPSIAAQMAIFADLGEDPVHVLGAPMRKLVALLIISVLPLATSGCKSLECGEGTIERDGICAPGEDIPGASSCGDGTELAPSGKCEPILDPAICDPNTTMEVRDPDTGVILCVGTGGGDCSTPLGGCDMAAANTMTVCGRIYDVETDNQLGAASADTSICPATGEANGPCALTIKPYDALQFAANPTGTTPLVASETYLDHCGRFRIKDIQPAGAPFIGLGVDDHPMHDNGNKLTGIAFPTVAGTGGGTRIDTVAYTTRTTTDAAWGSSSGAGASLAALGVYVNIYRDTGMTNDPLAGNLATGVTILRGGCDDPGQRLLLLRRDLRPYDRRRRPDRDRRQRHRPGPRPAQPRGVHRHGGPLARRLHLVPVERRRDPGRRVRPDPQPGRHRPATSDAPPHLVLVGRARARRPHRIGGRRSDRGRRRRAVPQLVRHQRRVRARGRAADADARPVVQGAARLRHSRRSTSRCRASARRRATRPTRCSTTS